MLVNALISLLTVAVIAAIAVDRKLLAPASEPGAAGSRWQRHWSPNSVREQAHAGRGVAFAAVAAALGLLLWGQLRLAAEGPSRSALAIWLIGAAGITGLSALVPAARANAVRLQDQPSTSNIIDFGQVHILRLLFGTLSAGFSIAVWRLTGPRGSGDHVNDVLALWILAMIAAALSIRGAPSRSSFERLGVKLIEHRWEAAVVVSIFIAALMLRVFPYGSHPRTMSGDEGVFAMQALEVTAGRINNYFAVVNTGNSNFIFAMLSGVMSIFGETVGGSRLLSAVIGALAILPTYALARLHFGRFVATLSAVFLTTSYFSIFWGRNTMHEVSAFLFAPLTLWLLDLGLISKRRTPALLAGFSIGLSLLFYSSNRILIPIAVLYGVYAICSSLPRSLPDLISAMRAAALSISLVVAGFLVSAMPLLSHFWSHPGSFNHRSNQVSVFTSGWLEREVEIRGASAPLILFEQFRAAALTPFSNQHAGVFIHPDPPLLGWPVVLPTVIGIAIVTLTFWKRQHFGFAAGFWATAAGTAITIGPGESHKLVTSISILAILSAVGILAMARVLLDLVRAPGLMVAAGVTATVLSIVIVNLSYYFGDPDRDAAFSDPNTQVAQSLAEHASALGPGTTVYLLGAPWMSYGGNSNIRFIARDAEGIDLVEPLTTSTPAPGLIGPAIFAVLPGREGEMDVIRSWFPDGVEKRHTWPDWGYLYSTYIVSPDQPGKRSLPAT